MNDVYIAAAERKGVRLVTGCDKLYTQHRGTQRGTGLVNNNYLRKGEGHNFRWLIDIKK